MAPLRVLFDPVARRLRASPLAGRMWARYRTWRLERRARRILAKGDGRADALPAGIVYESTMRCNLHCEFCYVGALLNIEGEWREELPLDMLQRAFPEKAGLQISLTGGEILRPEGHPGDARTLPRQAVRLRVPDDQRHRHHGRARSRAGAAGDDGLPETHQRVD